mmetsp:Transcript_41872/g.100899  ORF Transcript_41872/g.100899 Transcript_41872/m.100899 type:complete len:251 (-) Transcript_41872:94-846(-)
MGDSNSEIIRAARDGNLSRVQELWERGADVNHKNGGNGWTSLHWACEGDHLEVVKVLIEKGADVHAKNRIGGTSLHAACSTGQLELVKLLVEKGADVRATNIHGKTPSDVIQSEDERGPQIREMLLSRSLVSNSSEGTSTTPMSDPIFPDALLSDEDEENFPLHCAVKYGDLEVIKDVLQETRNEVDKNVLDSSGRTAIDLAALTGQITVLKLLAANGCKHKKPKPRMIAICKKRQGLAKKYLEQVEDSL